MLRTLHGRLSTVLLALLCLTALLYIPLTLYTTQRYFQEANQSFNRTLAQKLAEALAEKGTLRNAVTAREKATKEISKLMAINPSIEVYILDVEGRIIAYSAAPGKVQQDQVALEPVRRFLSGTKPLPVLGDDPRHPGQQDVFSVAPIPRQPGKQQLEGYVYTILNGEAYGSAAHLLQRSYILRFSLMMTAGIACLVLVTGLYLFHSLTRRLQTLTVAMETFHQQASPEASAPHSYRSGDEIDRVTLVFHQMAERIEHQVQQLRQADAQRRELVNNVSHDLRTPLAALQGYLETVLMKEGELTVGEQRNYITIATRHGERLSKLVSELFELAKLDSREVQVNAEPFSLGELVQDIAQKFQLVAQNKKLRLVTDFAPDLPFVSADIGLIERALQNLTDNAIRYTPEGGLVTLALVPESETIRVEVRDTGRGIRPEELPHIFERYYRVEDQPDTPGSAGLGLAITKRILELHGSAIEVHSTPGGGTTFAFVLPIYRPAS